MSFGASPSDIIIVATFCKNLYRKCRDASGEYDEISREVKSLFTVLRHLKYEVNAPESPLNRDQALWGRQLAPIVADCQSTLQQLDDLLKKYGRLDPNSSTPSSSQRFMWDKIRFGSNEMDQLGTIRVKLISHKTSLTLFLDTIQLRESGKMATTLEDHTEQLDMILDKVDAIAARMSQESGGSVMSTYSDDDKEVWKDFRRELVAEGFSSSVLQKHKEVLRAYIREIDQNGLLDELPPASPSTGVNPHNWLNPVQPPSSPGSIRTFDSVKSLRSDESAKEMMNQEDNLKFPTSMKFERPKPESRDQYLAPISQREAVRTYDSSQRQRSPIPILKVSNNKKSRSVNTSGSDDDSQTDISSKGSRVPSQGALIRTSDLIAISQALHVNSALLPSSFESQLSFDGSNTRRSIEFAPKDIAASPSQSIINGSLTRRGSNTSNGGQPTFRLAPDSQGKQIPSDAIWTKISRRLVSPEVLDQDRRRYEARPEFVAVLGCLSREDIESYAVRSEKLRAARSRRSSFQQPLPTEKNKRNMRDTPSSEDDSSDSDAPRHQQQRRNEPRNYTSSVAGSDITPRSGYPNPYGVHAPPSPASSPALSKSQPVRIPRSSSRHVDHSDSSTSSSPAREERDSHYHHSRKERDGDRRHSSSRSGASKREHRPHSSTRSSSTNSQRSKNPPPRRRFRDNLTAAGIGGGIGGAAASLLGVLAEAAEGI